MNSTAELLSESESNFLNHMMMWGVPGAVWQLVTHEFGQTWMRVR